MPVNIHIDILNLKFKNNEVSEVITVSNERMAHIYSLQDTLQAIVYCNKSQSLKGCLKSVKIIANVKTKQRKSANIRVRLEKTN